MASGSIRKESDLHVPKIESIPNLRLLCTRSQEHLKVYGNDCQSTGAVYRSSKPDRITADDVLIFKELGIKTIVDFRSLDEYRNTDGLCFLDKEYSLHKVLLPKKGYAPGDSVETELIAKADVPKVEYPTDQVDKKHYLINFFSSSYVMTSMKRVSWYVMIIGIFHAIYDLFKNNKFKTFIGFFIRHSINKGGIAGQYKDIVDVSGPAICAALKLISDPDNMPVLINCAHGKDRTGIMSALILICLGMSEEYVKKEYCLSYKGLEPIRHLIRAEMVDKLKLKEDFMSAKAETMTELLAYIKDKHGSVQNYMVHIGFSLEDQRQLQNNVMAFENQDCVQESSRELDSHHTPNGSDVDVKHVNFS